MSTTSSELPSQITNWLYNVLQPQYVHKKEAYSHLYFFLRDFLPQQFRIRTRVFTSAASGSQNLLLNLSGSFAVTAGTVPVEIWIPLNYPFSKSDVFEGENGVPIVFVTPDVQKHQYLRPGNFVDSQGKVYHPYLTRWFQNCVENNLAATREFNLIELSNVLIHIFEQHIPIFEADEAPAPVLPPKPAKMALEASKMASPSLTNQRIHTDPRAASASSIPAKYQSPLPLPGELRSPPSRAAPLSRQGTGTERPIPLSNQDTGPRSLSQQSTGTSQYQQGSYSQVRSPLRSPTQVQPVHVHPGPLVAHVARYSSPPPAQHQKSGSIDLMDRDDSKMQSTISISQRAEVLQQLSDAINKCLGELPENSPELYSTINTNTAKINGLYDQLKHHHTQALANRDNLQAHLDYLTSQVASINRLNQDLAHLDRLNSEDAKHVHTSTRSKIDLDELIVPDAMLTNQLYDLVSDIKATKDTIGLVSGQFGSQKELINDSNFNQCIKAVRSMGRDLFWMELTKSAIAKKMHLEHE